MSSLLTSIQYSTLTLSKGFYITASREGKKVGGIFVILDKDIAYYLIADGDIEAKKEGVVFGLMDQAIRHTRDMGYSIFDFGGSNVSSVAEFYRKFGARDNSYSRLVQDKTPKWFKLIKKLRRA